MDINYYKQYEPIFGAWHITRLIGEGSFGKVFEMEREDFGVTYKAALKAITIPASQSEVRSMRSEGMDEESVRDTLESKVQELVKEFALMSKLKGNSNVVSYENHQVIEHTDGIGWDILIQMELLTPLDEYITRKKTISRQEVIKLGIDLCKALELCQKHNIIHRDIKPENTFVSENGDFKLGDFGEARTLEKTTGGLSKKGTYDYMAPEVYHGNPYGTTVDIYSLGLILYRLLNGNRLPFLPPAPDPIKYSDRESARAKRFNGAPLPPPGYAEGRLGEIVLKACAFEPKERYSSPGQMRQELEAILYNKEEGQYIYPDGDEVPQNSIHSAAPGDEPPIRQEDGGTVSDFGDIPPKYDGKTVSDFGEIPKKAHDGKQKKAAGDAESAGKGGKKDDEQELCHITARMLPACAVVPLGPNRTTWALYAQCNPKECKVLEGIIKKYGIQQLGEVLGYCGVILNITIPYAVMFTSIGVMLPVALKVSRFLLDCTVHHTYTFLPYDKIQALALCMEKKLQGIELTLTGGEKKRLILPPDIYIHRTNVCKLIQALGRVGGNAISFQP